VVAVGGTVGFCAGGVNGVGTGVGCGLVSVTFGAGGVIGAGFGGITGA
jgi:hypothetical protein